jgi:hypothetical protein
MPSRVGIRDRIVPLAPHTGGCGQVSGGRERSLPTWVPEASGYRRGVSSHTASRRLQHPDIWDYVVHLTGRPPGLPNAEVPSRLRRMPAEERLAGILDEGRIRGFPPYQRGLSPVVCFTESTQVGLDHLIGERGFEPWGLVFAKTTVLAWGGGPVWYARPAQHALIPRELRHWAVETDPGRVDWRHEREWRVPATGSPPAIRFTPADVHAVIVGEFAWQAGDDDDEPMWARSLRRWYWHGKEKRLWEMGHFRKSRTLVRL